MESLAPTLVDHDDSYDGSALTNIKFDDYYVEGGCGGVYWSLLPGYYMIIRVRLMAAGDRVDSS